MRHTHVPHAWFFRRIRKASPSGSRARSEHGGLGVRRTDVRKSRGRSTRQNRHVACLPEAPGGHGAEHAGASPSRLCL